MRISRRIRRGWFDFSPMSEKLPVAMAESTASSFKSKNGDVAIAIDEGASRHVNDRMDACAPELAVNGFVGVTFMSLMACC
jgi:hypothetical protein